MTRSRKLKRRIRQRMAETGQRYTAARAAFVVADPPLRPSPKERTMRDVEIEEVLVQLPEHVLQRFVDAGHQADHLGRLILRETSGERGLLIYLLKPEAISIARAVQGLEQTRPMTHDLFAETLRATGSEVTGARVTRIDDKGTIYAELTVDTPAGPQVIDSRPSDAIAVAVRVGAPIQVADDCLHDVTNPDDHEVPPGR